MIVGTRKPSKSRRRPVSPGIPGDYFECNEMMLVTKLQMLRMQAKNEHQVQVPPLLKPLDSASIQSHDDNPNLFFEDDHSENDISANHRHRLGLDSEEFINRIEGEQLSVHSQSSSGTGESESKSWEGSQIVLNVRSFLPSEHLRCPKSKLMHTPSTDSQSDISPKCITTKLFDSNDCTIASVPQHSLPLKPTRMRPPSTPGTASLSLSRTSGDSSLSSSSYGVLKPHTPFQQNLPTITDVENDSSTKENENDSIPLHDHFASVKRRWSFSSSIGENEEAAQDNATDTARSFPVANVSVSSGSSQTNYLSLQEQELFIRLAEEEDLRDFKHINNFTSDGDYLFSRILRERTRIELKRQMLTSSDKDLYVQTHNRRSEESSSRDGNRSIYFAI